MKLLLSALLGIVLVQSTLSAPSNFSAPPFTTTPLAPPEKAVTEKGKKGSEGRLEQLLRTFGMSPCVSSCMFELNTDFVYRDDEEQADLKKVCDSYTRASQCFKGCPEVDQRLFDVTSSGIHYMCVEKREEFERAQPCLNEQKGAMKKECNQKCADEASKQIPSHNDVETTNSSHARNSSEVYEKLSVLCVVLRCSVGCGRDLLNTRCAADQHVGDLVTEVMLRPLEQNAVILDKSPPEVKEYVAHALPETCAYTIDIKQLGALRRGDKEDSELARMEPFKSDEPQNSDLERMEPFKSDEPQNSDLERMEPFKSDEPLNSDLERMEPFKSDEPLNSDLERMEPFNSDEPQNSDLERMEPFNSDEPQNSDLARMEPFNSDSPTNSSLPSV